MIPKRPVSCLAVLTLPVGMLLLLIVMGGYAVKFFFPPKAVQAPIAVEIQGKETQTQAALPSRLPPAITTSTKILVATTAEDPTKEQIYSVELSGTATLAESPQGWRPEQWKTKGITLTPPDEAVSSSPWRVTGAGWNVPLRTRNGAKWQDPVIWGTFSSGRLAIVAYRTQRALLSVSRAGDIQVVDVLPDDVVPLTVQGKYAWLVRTPRSEDLGLEELATGPSQLIRMSESGTSSTIAQDPGVILELVPSPSHAGVAYLSTDGSLVVAVGTKIRSDIKGWRPQAWLNERYLFVSQGATLGWIDTQQPTQIFFFSKFTYPVRGVSLSTSSSRPVLN